jgi:hypothetical protein
MSIDNKNTAEQIDVRPRATPDTVANAAATPDREQPYGALGLKADEYASIRDPRSPPHERRTRHVLGDVERALLVQVEQDLPAPVRPEGQSRHEEEPHGGHMRTPASSTSAAGGR